MLAGIGKVFSAIYLPLAGVSAAIQGIRYSDGYRRHDPHAPARRVTVRSGSFTGTFGCHLAESDGR